MGGRGSSSGAAARGGGGGASNTATPKQAVATKGGVKTDFINAMSNLFGVNLSAARDEQFDTRNTINIDTRKVDRNRYREMKSYIKQRGSAGGFDVTISDNGAHREAIQIKRKK